MDTWKQTENNFLFMRNKYIFDFALETWYDGLKEYTPKTLFIKLTLAEMKFLYNLCDTIRNDKKINDEDEIYIKLSREMDKIIKEEFDGQCFAKLSTRSPKDALNSDLNDKLKTLFIEELKQSSTHHDQNGDTISFSKATRRSLMMTSGKEVLEIFSKSSRIREDLMKALEFPSDLTMCIILREWFPMEPSMEFRAFVKNKKVNALSQYCYLQYFDNLVKHRLDIEKRISTFFDEIKDKITHENYVIDLVVLKDEIKIIELNPFFVDTSGCMFNWSNSKDKKIIDTGPFEFRVLERPIDHPYDCLPPIWKDFVIKYRSETMPVKRESDKCLMQ